MKITHKYKREYLHSISIMVPRAEHLCSTQYRRGLAPLSTKVFITRAGIAQRKEFLWKSYSKKRLFFFSCSESSWVSARQHLQGGILTIRAPAGIPPLHGVALMATNKIFAIPLPHLVKGWLSDLIFLRQAPFFFTYSPGGSPTSIGSSPDYQSNGIQNTGKI